MVKPTTSAPIPFGRYLLHEKIGSGGMAEIFLATAQGEAGFQKTCVIKRVLPHLAVNPDFVRMFLDEGRLAARLSHPGIVHTFDLGKQGESYFLAMEYLAGEDCAAVLARCEALNREIPITVAARVISAAAEALHHAHEAQDEHGAPLGIVHRDVSPSNVLITYQGVVKVLDFGIARVEHRAQSTEAGALKGKLAYMAPEQAKGVRIDRRADVWSLGVCLYELLANHRLFSGNSLPELLHHTQTRAIQPPSAARGDVPEALDRIVLTALERDPERRYPTALALRRALEQFLGSRTYVSASVELSEFLVGLYGAECAAERVRRARPVPASSEPTTAVDPPISAGPEQDRAQSIARPRRKWPWLTAAVLAVGAATLAGRPFVQSRLRPPLEVPVTRFTASIASAPPAAAIFLDGERLPERTPTTLSALRPGTYEVRLLKDGYLPARGAFELSEKNPAAVLRLELEPEAPPAPVSPAPASSPKVEVEARRRPLRAPSGFVTVRSNVPATVTLDGVPRGRTPLSGAAVPPGRHHLRVQMVATGASRVYAIEVRPGTTMVREVKFEKGRLNVSVDPWADVWAGDLKLGQTPLAGREVWEGRHRLRLVGPGMEKAVDVEVRPGETTVLEASLR